jgi:hypothetical protein
MAQSVFGVGFMFGIPQGANPTPVRFGRLQDVSEDFSFDLKPLHGSNQVALEQGRGKAKIDLKATIAVIDPNLFNQVFFGMTSVTGEILNSVDEAQTPSAGTFTVANGATMSKDFGVYNTITGLFMTRVASGPAAGQYAVNEATGVYTTNAAQNTQLLRVSYSYASASTGSTVTYGNQLMGAGVTFRLSLVGKFKGGDGIIRSYYKNYAAVQASKLSQALKLDDWMMPGLDMSAQDDGSGNVFSYSMTG